MEAPPPSLPREATLDAIVEWLRSQKVPGLIIGGIAASFLGGPRLTRDVDVLILLQENRWQRFLNAGIRFGFLPRIDDVLAFARRSRVFLIHHEPGGIDIDISVAALPFEEESMRRLNGRI